MASINGAPEEIQTSFVQQDDDGRKPPALVTPANAAENQTELSAASSSTATAASANAENQTGLSASARSSTATAAAPSKVCRFLVNGMKARGGRAEVDYYVDLRSENHGLFHLVEKVFELLHSENLTTDQTYSHLWNLTFEKRTYLNGWRGESISPRHHHIDEIEPRLLKDLDELRAGSKGSFYGESAKFHFVVVDTDLAAATAVEAEQENGPFPRAMRLPAQVTSDLRDDWLTEDEKSRCAARRCQWQNWYNGDNRLARDRFSREGRWILMKPEWPQWSPEEDEIMALLSFAGCKFKKSWDNLMQYAMLDRSQTAASGHWYSLQGKTPWRLPHFDVKDARNSSPAGKNSARVLLAKRQAKLRLEELLERGAPPTGPQKRARSSIESDEEDSMVSPYDYLP